MTPYYATPDGRAVLYHADCRDVLLRVAYDVIVTDPPYGTGTAPRGGAKAGTLDMNSPEWPTWDMWDTSWTRHVHCPVATFCGIGRVYDMASAIDADGLLMYVKSNPSPLGSSFEPCVTRSFPRRSPQHIVAYNAFNGQQHPTQKPLSVMRWIIRRSPRGIICDPFAGSGTTLVAAWQLGRASIGIEIEERYCEIAAKRLEAAVQQPALDLTDPAPAPVARQGSLEVA